MGMSSREIAELQQAVAELQLGLRSVIDSTHSTIHLLAYLFATRCLSAPDPRRAYKDTARLLLASIGGDDGADLLGSGDAARDAAVRGIRHHVSQFLLTLQAHVEANLKPDRAGRTN
jgi:hypothetical protein